MPGADRGVPSPTLLHDVLADAREAGFLGPGPIGPQIRHAEGFALVAHRLAASGPPRPRLVDLGSGGGLPGLVVALQWPEATLDLLEASGRRAAFLERAVSRLGLGAPGARPPRAGGGQRASQRPQGGLRRGAGEVVRPAGASWPSAPLPCSRSAAGSWSPSRRRTERDADADARWPAGPLRQLGLEPPGARPRGVRLPDAAAGRAVSRPVPPPRRRAGEEASVLSPDVPATGPGPDGGPAGARPRVPRETTARSRSAPAPAEVPRGTISSLDLGLRAGQDRRRAAATRRSCLMRIRRKDRETPGTPTTAPDPAPYDYDVETAAPPSQGPTSIDPSRA